MECKFNEDEIEDMVSTKIDGQEIPYEWFCYLGFVIQNNWEIDEDIYNRIRVGWMKWRGASGISCSWCIFWMLKEKFYRIIIRPAMLHDWKCWTIKKVHEIKLGVIEMRLLKWMDDKTRKDRLNNEYSRGAQIKDKVMDKDTRMLM